MHACPTRTAAPWAALPQRVTRHKAALFTGDLVDLDVFFNVHSIAAHRPPHIPALRMLPDVATLEPAELPVSAAPRPQLPAAENASESPPPGLTGAAGRPSIKAFALEADGSRGVRPQLRVSFK